MFYETIYFKKIELTKPARSDVGIVAKWIEEDWVSEYLFPFGICKGVAKDFLNLFIVTTVILLSACKFSEEVVF